MGVYIPNMEKPKDCSNCSFYDSEYPWACEPLQTVDGYECPMVEIDLVRCVECKHKPIKYDPEGDEFGFNLVSPNGYDNLCPCLNTDDGFYSYMPDDNFFCAYGERRADEHR